MRNSGRNIKKLRLSVTTVRSLTSDELSQVAGGASTHCGSDILACDPPTWTYVKTCYPPCATLGEFTCAIPCTQTG